jgi:hypothetical protein
MRNISGRPPGLLLLRAALDDAAHRQAGVDAEERGDRRVDAGELHRHERAQQAAGGGAVGALVAEADDVERCELRDQLVRELGPRPVVLDDRRDLPLGEVAHAAHQGAAVLVEQVLVAVEVTPQERQDLLLAGARHEKWPLGRLIEGPSSTSGRAAAARVAASACSC